jgi:hypothetical protein
MKVLNVLGKPFTALAGSVHHDVEQKIVMSLVRHAATTLGGVLLSHGLVAASDTEAVTGAIAVLLGAGAGALQKWLEAA